MTIPHASVLAYAQLAFSLVLDQHEIIILPSLVRAVPMNDGAIGLIYETAECSAAGRFTGDAHGGMLHLEHVRTPIWSANFDSTDRFSGSRSDGMPIFVSTNR